MKSVILKPGREHSLLRRHPWVFSGAVKSAEDGLASGETVQIRNTKGKALAVAAWSPVSQIRCRVWDFDPGKEIGPGFFRNRLQQAITRRQRLGLTGEPDSACRLIYSESDGLPGLIVDRYAGYMVCQFLSAGSEYFRRIILDTLQELLPDTAIYDRSDVDVRDKEGLPQRAGLICGHEPPEHVAISEHGIRYLVDIRNGHKTGFYLDQRDNRAWLQTRTRDRDVLNCFSYTGSFGLSALAGGARSVTNVDSSKSAMELAAGNLRHNGFDTDRVEQVEANVFEQLRTWRRGERRFDIIVLDPPKLIDSKQTEARGARAYKDVNMQAFALLRPGGLLITFSCSGLLSPQLMQKIVADAALDAGRQGRIIQRLGQSADHPVALNFPEADYLKGLCIQVD